MATRHERRCGGYAPVIEGDTRPFPRFTTMGSIFTSREARRGHIKFSTITKGDTTYVTGIYKRGKSGGAKQRYRLVQPVPDGYPVTNLPKYMCI